MRAGDHAPTVLALAAAWSCYSTLGLEYTVFALCLLSGAWQLHRSGRWHQLPYGTAMAPWTALWLLLLVSTLWTSAPAAGVVAHLWTYALVLLMPIALAAWTPDAAQKALRHFVVASALVGALNMLQHAGWLPSQPLWQRIVDAEGNQRIAISLLLALGGVLGLEQALDRDAGTRARRAAWLLAALSCIGGLALQDRRSGMLNLPLLLVVLVLARERSVWRRLALVTAIGLLAFATWQLSDGVRARFAEGVAELRAPRTPDTVSTSWGQRLYMLEITAGMVEQRPLLGHGVATWPLLWQQRTVAGTPLHEHTTPHNEYLMVATQAGAVGLLLLLAGLASSWRQAWRNRATGSAALLVWTMLATSSLFNAMLRDAKFALPLLTLAALAGTASSRRPLGS